MDFVDIFVDFSGHFCGGGAGKMYFSDITTLLGFRCSVALRQVRAIATQEHHCCYKDGQNQEHCQPQT